MKIRFQPRRGTPVVVLRDIVGGNQLSRWQAGDEREIPAGQTVLFKDSAGPPRPTDAVEVLFRHGPDFVDAATGKNPLFTCADCGEEALTRHAFDYSGDKTIPLVNDKGQRLCVADFLAHNPQWIPEFRRQDVPKDVIARAQTTIAKREAAAAAPAPDRKPDTSTAAEVK